MPTKHQQLYQLLYEWEVQETCNQCKHLYTWHSGSPNHPCNHCDCYERFAVRPEVREELNGRVKQILKIVNSKE